MDFKTRLDQKVGIKMNQKTNREIAEELVAKFDNSDSINFVHDSIRVKLIDLILKALNEKAVVWPTLEEVQAEAMSRKGKTRTGAYESWVEGFFYCELWLRLKDKMRGGYE